MFVRNVKGHFKEPEGYDSWLDWWRDHAPEGIVATECQNHDCDESDNLVGAHVYHDGHPDGDIYVVPLCYTHNHYTYTKVMQIDDPRFLVRMPNELLVKDTE